MLPLPQLTPHPVRRLHVVGCHRSGTTLMAELLGSCFDIQGRVDHEQGFWVPVEADAGVFLTKKPPDTIRIRTAFLMDPRLYVIAMIRDPRGVITSRHKAKPEVFFSSFWRWQQYLRAIMALDGHPRFLLIRYEDLVADPDAVQARIAERFEFLHPVSDFSRFPEGARIHERARISLNGVRAVDAASLSRWREELPRVKGELLRHPEMSDWLIRLGYEPDDAWTRELEGVEPYFGDYKNERPHVWRRFDTSVRFAYRTLYYLWQRQRGAAGLTPCW